LKRILLLAFLFLTLLFLSLVPTSASENQIYLASGANRNYDGEITNKSFESSLAPNGSIGTLIFQNDGGSKTWIIDGALLEDVQFLIAQDSELASNWMERLKRVVGGDTVYATAYGNPDVRYLQSLAPAELAFYYDYGQGKVSEILGRNVRSEKGSGLASTRANIDRDLRQFLMVRAKSSTISQQ